MNVEAQDFYARLGIAPDATQAGVKKAYVSAVRAHPPERYPEEFRRIREAYETLSDPGSRGTYDATSDPRVKDALKAGQQALNDGEPLLAVRHLKKVLVVQPGAHFARNLLGLALGYAGEFREAKEQFVRLTSEVPDNHVYWHNRGYAERMLNEPGEAEISFRRAIKLHPTDSDAQIGLANALFEGSRKHEAQSVLEDAIQADGVVDFDDISYFFEMIRLKVYDQDVPGIQEVTQRIETILEEQWQRERVAYRYAVLANELSEMLAFDLAEKLARQSRNLLPNDEKIAAFADHVLANQELMHQWSQLQDDDAIRGGLKFFLATAVRAYFGAWEDEKERQRQIQQAFEVLGNSAGLVVPGPEGKRTLSEELEYVDEKYPKVAGLVPEQARARVLVLSAGAEVVALTCPHCGHGARAPDESGRYTCPECDRPFDYDSRRGRTEKWSGAVQGQRFLKKAAIWVAWIVGILILSALLGG